ncbi:hypothetical protein NDU88_002065 [Pleurodeles waltl]|uniref:Uncharacterized protein n=1 Tax=Pleurodeles waltl TaxID=8319 RepID=A0AAV7P5S0_PLEWA|nr:hypothetical protein NDU88_002065 [Pleurodeles waltl]
MVELGIRKYCSTGGKKERGREEDEGRAERGGEADERRAAPGQDADDQSREEEEDEEQEEWFEAEAWDSAREAKAPTTVLENRDTRGE